eukprot:1087561-Heterocapsa_arctica.AAC.1
MLQFKPSPGGHVPTHETCERVVPYLNHSEPGDEWRSASRARFLELWSAQTSKLPVGSQSHMASLA